MGQRRESMAERSQSVEGGWRCPLLSDDNWYKLPLGASFSSNFYCVNLKVEVHEICADLWMNFSSQIWG